MHVTYRSYLTSGVAALGVGAIALAPIQPVPGHVALAPDKAVSTLAVELAASIDPITPWVDTIKTSLANVQQLLDFYLEKPFPLIQTIAANQVTYFQELPDVGLVAEQVWGNVQTFFQAPWSPGDPAGEYISPVPVASVLSIPISQQFVFGLLPTILGDQTYTQYEPILNFLATPYSGQVVGLLGPLFAPLVELTRSFTAIGQFFQDGDVIGAINELINIPARVTNGVLNGAGYLDLTGVVNAIAPLPPEIKNVGLNLGGLISPPVPIAGTLDAPTAWNGGVAFDSLAAGIDYKVSEFPRPNGTSVVVNDPGIPVSWIGSAIGLGQLLSEKMVVTPPMTAAAAETATADTSAAPAPAAVAEAAPAEFAAPEVAAPEVAAPAVAEETAPAAPVAAKVADVAAEVKVPKAAAAAAAVEAAVEAPAQAGGKAAAGSANSGNEKAAKASARGMGKSGAARGAR